MKMYQTFSYAPGFVVIALKTEKETICTRTRVPKVALEELLFTWGVIPN